MVEEIKGFLQLDDRIGTSGMPRAEHFREIAEAGYRAVINLALPTSDNALANEGELVSGEGMSYVHIPIKFEEPREEDYENFARVMDAFSREKVFVHCAANMRVSAFIFLYRLEHGADRGSAEAAMNRIWELNNVWRNFLNARLRQIGQKELD
jgi:protein tyrosine phosphatase (PTP) superfamily phosphohydrolase (DUF442 family)